MNDLAILNQTVKTMSSREIAQLCEKQHGHVCRDIEQLNQTYEQMGLSKIGQGYYTHPSTGSQQHREFLLTKEQSIDLVTGYNRELRIAINRRWQELENKELKEKVPVLTQAQMLHQMTAMLVEQERKTLALENDVKEIKATQSAIIENTHHFATMGFARNHGIKLDTMLCAKLSRKCTSLSKTLGVVMGKAPDTRFGTVNTYHKDILKEVFTQEGLI